MAPAEHPIERVWQRLARREAVVAGVLSGTSADGIDVVLARSGREGPCEPLAFATHPFPLALAGDLRSVLDGRPTGARALAFLTRDLGLAFGRAARELAEAQRLELDLVGSHGQTVFHHDGVESAGAATLQLGDGDFVAQAAGALTVSDFRMADLASGGEGAPLSALLDPVLFPRLARPGAVLNLGGIANVTFLPRAGPPLAFDTGPANALLDGLARTLLGQPFDVDGTVARSGRVAQEFLARMLGHAYFRRPPPKSTGRDTFGTPYVSQWIEGQREAGLSTPDGLATAVEFVAASVAEAFERFLPDRPQELVLAGGGVHNRALVERLAARTGLRALSSAEHGIDPDAREALFFAHLAVRQVLAIPSTEPSVSGARRGGVLGKLSLPPLASLPRAGIGPGTP